MRRMRLSRVKGTHFPLDAL